MLSFSGCTKDVPVTKDAAVYELIFTDVDGIVYHSSEILADLPEDSVCEGIYYKGVNALSRKNNMRHL